MKACEIELTLSSSEMNELSSATQISLTKKSFKIFDENMAVVTTRKTKMNWAKPTIVGASILDLSKAFMFRFHYENMKQWFKCELLYSGTDALTYAVDCDDLYEELGRAEVNTEFDFSNYPSDNALYNTENHMVTLKFKDELAGVIMEEFCGLKPKMYSIQTKGMCNIIFY